MKSSFPLRLVPALVSLALVAAALLGPGCGLGPTAPPSFAIGAQASEAALRADPDVARMVDAMAERGCAVDLSSLMYIRQLLDDGRTVVSGLGRWDCSTGRSFALLNVTTVSRPGSTDAELVNWVAAYNHLVPGRMAADPANHREFILPAEGGGIVVWLRTEELWEQIKRHVDSIDFPAPPGSATAPLVDVGATRAPLWDVPNSYRTACEHAVGARGYTTSTDASPDCCECMSDVTQCLIYAAGVGQDYAECTGLMNCVADVANELRDGGATDFAGHEDDINRMEGDDVYGLACAGADRASLLARLEADSGEVFDDVNLCHSYTGSLDWVESGENASNGWAQFLEMLNIFSSANSTINTLNLTGFSVPGLSTAGSVAKALSIVITPLAEYESNLETMIRLSDQYPDPAMTFDGEINVGSGTQYYCYKYQSGTYPECVNPACASGGETEYPACAGVFALCSGGNVSPGDPGIIWGVGCDTSSPLDGMADESLSYGTYWNAPEAFDLYDLSCCESNTWWGWINPDPSVSGSWGEDLFNVPPARGTCVWHGRTEMDYWGRSCTYAPEMGTPDMTGSINPAWNESPPCSL